MAEAEMTYQVLLFRSWWKQACVALVLVEGGLQGTYSTPCHGLVDLWMPTGHTVVKAHLATPTADGCWSIPDRCLNCFVKQHRHISLLVHASPEHATGLQLEENITCKCFCRRGPRYASCC